MKTLVGLGIVSLAVAAVVAATPYLAVHRLKSALLAGDAEEIRACVDFARVGRAMREDAAASVAGDARTEAERGGGVAVLRVGLAGAGPTNMIDPRLTPERLAEIARGGRSADEQGADAARVHRKDAPRTEWRIRQRSLSGCVVEVREPGADGGVDLSLGRRGLFSWQVQRIAFVARPRPKPAPKLQALAKPRRPTDAEIFRTLGCKYNPARKDALCPLPAGYQSYSDCLGPSEHLRAHVFGIYKAGAGDSARLFALVTSLPDNVPGSGPWACGVRVGGIQYRLVDGRWQMESANLVVTEDGTYGAMGGDVSFVRVGKERYGVIIGGDYMNHGVTGFYAQLIAVHGGRLLRLGGAGYQTSDATTMLRCRDGFSTSTGSWRLDTTSGGEFYDVIVEHGAEVCENFDTNAKRTVSPAWTERLVFSGDEYKSNNPHDGDE